MPNSVKTGAPIIGLLFLVLALFKFIQGDPWVVWAILAFVFGGFGIFSMNRSGGNQA